MCQKCEHIRQSKNKDKLSPLRLFARLSSSKKNVKNITPIPRQPNKGQKMPKPEISDAGSKARANKSLLKSKDVYLESITGLEFEDVCANIFKRCGFLTKKIGGTADAGRDILIWNGSGKIVVECKKQKNPIGRQVIQKLHSAVMTEENAVGGVVVSTGGFSSNACKHQMVRVNQNKYAGQNILNDIKRLSENNIILIDMDRLKILAKNARINIHDGKDPSTRNMSLIPVRELFADLKSSPATARDLIDCKIQGHHIKTYWIVDVKLDQNFCNSSGINVHRMKKKEIYTCSHDGTILGGKLAKLVKSGGDTVSKNNNWKDARRIVILDMKNKHTKNKRYKGNNGVHYTMQCTPNERHMRINCKPIGVNETDVEVKILHKKHKWRIPWWDDKVKCSMCGEPSKIMKPLLICNDCGSIAHVKDCGGTCDNCNKTICESCSMTKKKILKTKRLCSNCNSLTVGCSSSYP